MKWPNSTELIRMAKNAYVRECKDGHISYTAFYKGYIQGYLDATAKAQDDRPESSGTVTDDQS